MNRIGDYEVTDLLGDGGMGTVHRGRDPRFDRPVAIKVLHAQFARDPEVSERFRAEAVIQAKLSHPNIVSVYDFVTDGDRLAMVMELVEGEPLDRVIARHPDGLPVTLALAIAGQVLSALGFAHGRGLVHRDVKPSNVMVRAIQGEVLAKVMDFGVAKILGSEKLRTATSAKIGTLAYMAPEQIRSPKGVDARADLYSVGVLLYEMLTGRVPFDAESEFELMRQAIEEEPPAPSRVVVGLDPRWDGVIARAIAKAPAHRFPSALQMRDELLSLSRVDAGPQRVGRDVEQTSAKASELPREDRSEGTRPLARSQVKKSTPLPLRWKRRWPMALGAAVAVVASVWLVASSSAAGRGVERVDPRASRCVDWKEVAADRLAESVLNGYSVYVGGNSAATESIKASLRATDIRCAAELDLNSDGKKEYLLEVSGALTIYDLGRSEQPQGTWSDRRILDFESFGQGEIKILPDRDHGYRRLEGASSWDEKERLRLCFGGDRYERCS